MQSTGTTVAGHRKDHKGRDSVSSNSIHHGAGVGTSAAVNDNTQPNAYGDPKGTQNSSDDNNPDIIALENEMARFVTRGPVAEPARGAPRRPTGSSRQDQQLQLPPGSSAQARHVYSDKRSGTERQNVHPSAHTSAEHGGPFIAEDSNPEIIDLDRRMEQMFRSRGPPSKPTGTRPKPPPVPKPPTKPKPDPSSTQPQTLQRSEVQMRLPAGPVQGLPVASAASDRPPQPRTQTNQTTRGQTHKVSHGEAHQSHAQMPQVSHAQAHQVPHRQTHQVSHAQTYQPTQVQMPRAAEGGTSSHDQQRSADRRRKK